MKCNGINLFVPIRCYQFPSCVHAFDVYFSIINPTQQDNIEIRLDNIKITTETDEKQENFSKYMFSDFLSAAISWVCFYYFRKTAIESSEFITDHNFF